MDTGRVSIEQRRKTCLNVHEKKIRRVKLQSLGARDVCRTINRITNAVWMNAHSTATEAPAQCWLLHGQWQSVDRATKKYMPKCS